MWTLFYFSKKIPLNTDLYLYKSMFLLITVNADMHQNEWDGRGSFSYLVLGEESFPGVCTPRCKSLRGEITSVTSMVTLIVEFKALWQAVEALLWTLPGLFSFFNLRLRLGLLWCYSGSPFIWKCFPCHLCSLDVHFAHLQGSHPRSPACHSGRRHQQGALGQVPVQNSRIPKWSPTSWEQRS